MSIFVSVSFSAVNGIYFRQDFRLRPKMTNAFQSASNIHHKKVLVLVLYRLGLGLERILKLFLVLKLRSW